MSGRVEKRVFDLLGRPTYSPYGNPIPGLDVLEDGEPTVPQSGFRVGLTALDEIVVSDAREFVVRRLGEPLQNDPALLGQLSDAGVRPGRTVVARRAAGSVVIGADGATELDLPEDVAGHIFVETV